MNLKSFVFYTGIYNILLATSLLYPPLFNGLLGLELSYPGNYMISGFLFFTAIVLIICSRDIKRYASFIYYEGLLRILEAGIMFHGAFWGDAGILFAVAACGDLIIGMVYIIQLSRQT